MNVVDTFIEVVLPNNDNFLVIKETLSRIGIASKTNNTLYQTCHILHKQGHYYITHFKEMFMLDGKETTFSDTDRKRRNTITNLLEEWNLLEIIDPDKTEDEISMSKIKIVPFKEKDKWTFEVKYSIGNK